MVDVARRMAGLDHASNGWAHAPTQLVSSRLEQGARLGSTPSSSIDSSSASSLRWPESALRTQFHASDFDPSSSLQRTESLMSTGTVASATIAKASTATIRKLERSDASATPFRFAKHRKDPEDVTPSSSVEQISSRTTDLSEYPSSPGPAGDQSHATITTSRDTTLQTPTDQQRYILSHKFDGVQQSTSPHAVDLDLVEPKSFFSDSFSGDDSSLSMSATATSRLALNNPQSLRLAPISRRGSEQANSDVGTSEFYTSAMSHSSSYQSAISSFTNAAESLAPPQRATRYAGPLSSASVKASAGGAKFGLGIQTRGVALSSHQQQLADYPVSSSRYLAGPSLEAVPEARESPHIGSSDAGTPSALRIATALPLNNEPVWGESFSAAHAGTSDPNAGAMASFSFPSPIPSSAGFSGAANRQGQSASLSAKFPRSPGSAFHSSNPSIQSSVSNARHPFSSRTGDVRLLHASGWNHAPPSSWGGSVISSTAATSALGFTGLNSNSRDDMLQRLLLDQTRVDCQEYGTLSLEEVAEAKRDLKHIERKVQSLRTKLKVEIKIRDAAVALRKAHRRTAASTHSPTSSVSVIVSPTSPGFGNAHSAATPASASSSLAARNRAFSISASEAKADEDVIRATAKVDKVANELLKLNERANTLRRKLLEHQAATLSERVQHLESDRHVMEEKLPFLTASTSFESLAPSASASAVGIARYRDGGHRYQPSSDEPYIPRGPDDVLRHNRLESDLSAISGFSFLDATAPEKLRRLGEELEKKRETVRKLETELDSVRDAARRKDQVSDRLTQQLEEQSRESSRAVEEMRTLKEQLERQAESAQQAQAQAVAAAVADVEQRMHRQIEHSRSRDLEKEDALVNAKAEVMAGQRTLSDVQARLEASQKEVAALQLRAAAAETTADEHKRKLDDTIGESTRQLGQGSQDLASLQKELQAAKTAQDEATILATSRGEAIAGLERQLQQVKNDSLAEKDTLVSDRATATAALERQLNELRDDHTAEKQSRAQAEEQLGASRKQIAATQSRANQAESKLRELELAVDAERRIMAERDGLFHAFERRLESAEKRLQEQDKRCARMLGKLEGREEMDDLLERIKAGALGVAKKQKTAGQDIADLLSSLETHIGDLELELARANAQMPATPRDSTAPSDEIESGSHLAQLEASVQEAQTLRAEVQRLEDLLNSEQSKQAEVASAQDQTRLEKLEAEVTALSEQNKLAKDREEARESQLKAELHDLNESKAGLERQGKERVKLLEDKLDQLEARNRELEKQLRSASDTASPAVSVDALPLRSSKVSSPRNAAFPLQNKGVGNLIDRFGGGRKVTSESRADDSPAMLQACIRSVESLRAMLPDISAAAKGSAGLHALRDAFQATVTSPTSPVSARSPTSTRLSLGAADLQTELDAIAERLRSTLAISRAVIDLALDAEADKENRDGLEVDKQQQAMARAQAEAVSSQQALVTRVTSLTAKVKEQTDREKRLKAELEELRQQLEDVHNAQRAPSSPSGLLLGSESMLGLSTSPARAGEASLLSLPRSLARMGSNKSLRSAMADKLSPGTVTAYSPGAASLAPLRSPARLDFMPSPTRSNISVQSSPSIRYISPYAPPSFEARSQIKQGSDSHNLGADRSVGNIALPERFNIAESTDSTSLHSVSSPSSTHLGLPSSAASLADTSHSSVSLHRTGPDSSQAASTTPNGTLKRTITLGMDVPQLVSRVRELERQLSQTASIRHRAERVVELETQLREANQAYAKLLDRMDAERNIGTHQKIEMRNELNDAQTKLQTKQAQIQRAQTHSPLASLGPPSPRTD